MGDRERKNLTQMSRDAFLSHLSPITSFFDSQAWNAELQNERRLQVMQQCSQTKIRKGFTLIIDDSGHRKSGKSTAGVGRQYMGQIGKTDKGVALVTTHLYDG